jgi:hypothetical protein
MRRSIIAEQGDGRYIKFWSELKALIANSDLSQLGIARLIEAEHPSTKYAYRQLCRLMARTEPPGMICFLIAILESLGYELVIKKK